MIAALLLVQAIGAECADCHADIVRSYAETGMARALRPLDAEEVRGLESVSSGAWRYRFEVAGDAAWVVESFAGEAPEGLPPHRRSARLAFAIGAGIQDTAFACEVGERLWFAPLEVLREPRHAALAPGHAMGTDARFSVAITAECLACHTDALPPPEFPRNLVPNAPWKPQGISCAACHGDAEAHARFREAELAGESPTGGDPLLDLAAMGANERMSLCARCHLQGDARIDLRPGPPGLPPPGGDLLERRAVFVAETESDEVGFVSQTERLVLSACYTASEGRLVCATCHDPHRSLEGDAERARVRGACAECHEPHALDDNAARDDDCVDCHMPRVRPYDLHGVRIHDHFIRTVVEPPADPEGLRLLGATDGRLKRFAWPGDEAPASAGIEMMAYYRAKEWQRALDLADGEPGEEAAKLAMYHHVRGTLLEVGDRNAEALAAYDRAVELDPDLAESDVNASLVLGELGRVDEGMARLDRVLERFPDADGALRNRVVLLARRDDAGRLVESLEAAFACFPTAPLARALSIQAARRGDAAGAERWRVEALRIDPTLPLW